MLNMDENQERGIPTPKENNPLKFIFEKNGVKRPLYVFSLFQTFLQVIGVVSVAVAVIPWIAIPLVPLGIIFFVLRRYFLATSRDVKRLESTSDSTEQNAFPQSKHLTFFSPYSLCLFRVTNPEAWFLFLTTSRWFAVRLDAICALFVIVVAFGSLILAKTLDAGRVGLALSYALTLMGMFQWCVRQSAEVENMVTFILTFLAFSTLLAIKWHKGNFFCKILKLIFTS
ncbi:Multidrug resistance-associated protein 4 [Camelus dromedarius]|uniref:Multidrug resistance-associated protein 4 n=1 Tax=Camelus dromedarius TaxID=9838 RepID=A0A5N4D973_CAMDR|nr:Multidrug resistance-associated protein 4 [Camelus dromedarius]